jgi:AraC family transcriptional regulator, regulatory protein of adaptative response / DNA-3-methyladenine glycosylase II
MCPDLTGLAAAGDGMTAVMQGVSGVVTTGIYCRPGCSAQPLARNVRRFSTAAAAEAAGYRACLRCRPYRLPPVMGAIQPELVCRAVQMILDGALDDGTEAALADRLGVSARHLRRLFMTQLGATPDGLARSARAHFARRLLDETDLTITEIAFVVGFGSLRQFNRVCREVFRASPSDLRAKRRRSDRLVADGGLALRLAFHGPLDWTAMTACLARAAIPGVEHVSGNIYRRTVLIAGDPGVLELLPGDDDHLILRAHLPHWRELLHVVSRARHIASLDSDVREPVRQLGSDPVVGPLVRARPGVRVPGTWDAYETGIRAIVARDRTTSAANSVMVRLVERHGSPVAGLRELGLTHTFPGPGVLADADFTGIGLVPARAAAVRAFATATADGTVHLDCAVGLGELIASLEAIPGVGTSTAHYVALRLGEPDAFPVSGRHLAGLPAYMNSPSAARPEIGDRWRPWRALAVTHLWMSGNSYDPVAQKGAALAR